MDFKVVIPARYASTRLPGKPLLPLAGKPMIQHVYERAQASGASEIIIATDDERIAAAVEDFGGEVCVYHTLGPIDVQKLRIWPGAHRDGHDA